MKGLSKLVALGAVLAASSSIAFADPISGSFSITGSGQYVPQSSTSGTITVSGATVGAPAVDGPPVITGTFASYLTPGNPVTIASPISFVVGPNTVSSTSPAIVVSEGGETFNLYATSFDGFMAGSGTQAVGGITDGIGYIVGSGLVNYDMTPASFSFTIQAGGETTFSAQADANAVTPEPNSLVLLGTGLFGAAGMLFMRRRNASAF